MAKQNRIQIMLLTPRDLMRMTVDQFLEIRNAASEEDRIKLMALLYRTFEEYKAKKEN